MASVKGKFCREKINSYSVPSHEKEKFKKANKDLKLGTKGG